MIRTGKDSGRGYAQPDKIRACIWNMHMGSVDPGETTMSVRCVECVAAGGLLVLNVLFSLTVSIPQRSTYMGMRIKFMGQRLLVLVSNQSCPTGNSSNKVCFLKG